MADLTKYNWLIAWYTIALNVFQLTRVTTENPATYRLTVRVVDTNNKGQGQKEPGYWFTDYMGNPYQIIAVDTNTIDVSDAFRTGYCPTSGKMGIIHKSAYKGHSIALPSGTFRHLSSLAASNNNKFAMAILWGNDPNGVKIPFVATDVPSIENYQIDQVNGDGVTVNYQEDFGDMPGVLLVEEKVDDFTGDVIQAYRPETSTMVMVDNKISRIYFGQLDVAISGFILLFRRGKS